MRRPELRSSLLGSKQRPQRGHTRNREAILVAARELATADGVRNVSLRQIAKRIHYTPAALYTYFSCKEDIFSALVAEDAAVLDRRLDEATRDVADPLARIRCALWALYEFGHANPVFIELMILDVSRAKARHRRLDYVDDIGARLEDDIRTCIRRSQLPRALSAAWTRQLLWIGMLGAAAIAARTAPGENGDMPIRVLLEGLLAGPASELERHVGHEAIDAGPHRAL